MTGLLSPVALFLPGTTHDYAIWQAGPSILSSDGLARDERAEAAAAGEPVAAAVALGDGRAGQPPLNEHLPQALASHGRVLRQERLHVSDLLEQYLLEPRRVQVSGLAGTGELVELAHQVFFASAAACATRVTRRAQAATIEGVRHIEIRDDRWVEIHENRPRYVEAKMLSITRRYWRHSRFYAEDGSLWRPEPVEGHELALVGRLLAHTINPRRTLTMSYERIGDYSLDTLRTSVQHGFLGVLAAIGDVEDEQDRATEFGIAEAANFDEVFQLVRVHPATQPER